MDRKSIGFSVVGIVAGFVAAGVWGCASGAVAPDAATSVQDSGSDAAQVGDASLIDGARADAAGGDGGRDSGADARVDASTPDSGVSCPTTGSLGWLAEGNSNSTPAALALVAMAVPSMTSPSPAFVAGHRSGGMAFDFNGMGWWDGADGGGSYFDILGSHASIEVWVRPTTAAQSARIVDKLQSPGALETWTGFTLDLVNGAPRLYVGSGRFQQSSTVLAPNVWHHLVATFDAGAIALYQNGNDISAGTTGPGLARDSAILANDAPFRVGAHQVGTLPYRFVGQIDDLILYTVTLTAAQARCRYDATR